MGLRCGAKNHRHSTGELTICWLLGGRGWVLAFPPPFQLLKWFLYYVSMASRLVVCPQKLPFKGMRLFTHLSQHCSSIVMPTAPVHGSQCCRKALLFKGQCQASNYRRTHVFQGGEVTKSRQACRILRGEKASELSQCTWLCL